MATTRARPGETVADRLLALDVAGLRFARTFAHTPQAERIVRAYTRLGQHGALWLGIGAAGVALDRSRRPHWRRAARAVVVANAVNQTLKLTVRRRRPQLPDLPPLVGTPTQLSFPSAHAVTSAAAVHAYWDLAPPLPLRAAATAMVLSRVYLGVHYPSDIVAGVLLGALVGNRLGPTSSPR